MSSETVRRKCNTVKERRRKKAELCVRRESAKERRVTELTRLRERPPHEYRAS